MLQFRLHGFLKTFEKHYFSDTRRGRNYKNYLRPDDDDIDFQEDQFKGTGKFFTVTFSFQNHKLLLPFSNSVHSWCPF